MITFGDRVAAEYSRPGRRRGRDLLLIVWASLAAVTAAAQDIERDPIRYSAATPRNAVAALEERLAKGTAKLEYETGRGYLRSLLRRSTCPSPRRSWYSPRRASSASESRPRPPAQSTLTTRCWSGSAIAAA